MTDSPTSQAMHLAMTELKERAERVAELEVALAACLEILQTIRPDYFHAVHGNQGGCDFDLEVCEQCARAGDPVDHEDGCFSEKLDAAIHAADDALARSVFNKETNRV